MTDPSDRPRLSTRRDVLRGGVLAGAGLLLAACTTARPRETVAESEAGADGGPSANDTAPTADPPLDAVAADAPLTVAQFTALGTCGLLPASTAGPFPLDEQFDRRDITEGYPGQPMRLGFRVLDDACEPVPGATVEIWHTDATGDYSAFADGGDGKDEGTGTTFMRGTQRADGDGIVEFLSIYPGWYRGRAVHIHLRVAVDGERVLTGQVYFDDAYTAAVYASHDAYVDGAPDTSTSADRIAGDARADGAVLATVAAPTSAGDGTLALLNLGVPV